jgi:hypothetical protein
MKNAQQKHGITWHTAFYDAIRLEFLPYKDVLDFKQEFQLTTEPLRIDVLVVKKKAGVVIDKNIASIFKGYNIIEYKSPSDYFSVDDFQKVYAYALLYSSLEKVPLGDISLSIVENHKPQALFDYFTGVRAAIRSLKTRRKVLYWKAWEGE